MADGTNLFDLAAKISVDASGSDKALTATQKRVLELAAEFKKTETTATQAVKKIETATSSAGASIVNSLQKQEQAAKQASQAIGKDLTGAVQQLSPAMGSLAGASGPITLVTIGLTAVAAGAAAAGYAVFSLAKFAADSAGEIFDLTQKTNFSAETLSALGVAAVTSGGSLASLSTGLAFLDKGMEKSAQSTAKHSDVFKRFKIDVVDNEKALRQVFVVLQGLDRAQQIKVAGDFFGARSARDMLGVMKDSGGDVDAWIKKMREAGRVISGEDAAAADRFGDSLNALEGTIKGIVRTVGTELLPVFTNAFQDISAALEGNESRWHSWGKAIAEEMISIEGTALGMRDTVREALAQMGLDIGNTAKHERNAIADLAIGFAKQINPAMGAALEGHIGVETANVGGAVDQAAARRWQGDGSGQRGNVQMMTREGQEALARSRDRLPIGGGAGGGGRGPDLAAEQRQISALMVKIVEDQFKAEADAEKRSLALRQNSLQEYADNSVDIEARRLDAVMARLDDQTKAALKLRRGSAAAVLAIDVKRDEELTKSLETLDRLDEMLSRDQVERAQQHEAAIMRIRDITGQTSQDRWQRLADVRVITEEEAVKQIGRIQMESLQRQMEQARNAFIYAGANRKEQEAALLKMGEIEAQMGALGISTANKITDATRAAAAAQRQFNVEMQTTTAQLQIQLMEIQKQAIARGISTGRISARSGRAQTSAIDLKEENAQFEISKRKATEDVIKAVVGQSLDDTKKLYDNYYGQIDVLEKQHAENVASIRERGLVLLTDQLRNVADQTASIFSNAIRAGLQDGAKAGFKSMITGFAEMLAEMAEKMLASAVFRMLTKLMKLNKSGDDSSDEDSGGGGGGLAGIIMALFSGGHAAGGFIPPGHWGIVGERGPEPAFGGRTGMTVQPSGSGGGGNTFIVQVLVPNTAAAGSQQTQYQVGKQLNALMARVALTG